MTPVKLTPFGRQSGVNITTTPIRHRDITEGGSAKRDVGQCNRILTYDASTRLSSQITLNGKLQEIMLSQNQSPTPTPFQIQKIGSVTPITKAMEMNNWLQEQLQKVKIADNGLSVELNNLMKQAPKAIPQNKGNRSHNEEFDNCFGYGRHSNPEGIQAIQNKGNVFPHS
jgi:hypothetical protein